MDILYDIDGNVRNDIVSCDVILTGICLIINLPPSIEERNIYKVDTREQFATLKPKKFNGLSYKILDFIDEFAKIKTIDYGDVLVKITDATPLSNYPYYERGNY